MNEFVQRYQDKFKEKLNDKQTQGLIFLHDKLVADNSIIKPLKAYFLATTKHEADNKYQPIPEYGRGKGYKYGQPDPETGLTYYGRGYVQITWKGNYQTLGKLLGLDLVHKPDLALEPETAYKIMVLGMTKGLFGRKVTDFINSAKTDFVGARRSVNGTDRATLVAGYADKFLSIL